MSRKTFKAIKSVLVLAGFLAMPPFAYAMESVELLPEGINSPSVTMGFLSGLGARYNSDGELWSLNALNSLDFDVKKLKAIEPQVADLELALNSFGRGQVGSQLHLGRLSIEAQPSVQYFAPIHAWGLNKNWSVGFGLPVLKYRNQVNISSYGSNLEVFKKEFGGLSSSLDSAFKRLNVNLVSSLQTELAQKGYEVLGDRDETLLGDLNLVSLYQLADRNQVKLVHRATLILPTGTKSNPDDLLSLDLFGEFAIENQIIAQRNLPKGFSLAGRLGYKFALPQTMTKRVPQSPDDVLPEASSKQELSRQKGSVWSLGTSLGWKFDKALSFGLGYEFQSKEKDRFSGVKGWAEGLSKDTDQMIHKIKAGVSFSSVQSYFDKTAMIPAILNFEFSDIFAGKNTPRQTLLELSAMLFY